MSTKSQSPSAIFGVTRVALLGWAMLMTGCLELQSTDPTPDRSTCTACHGDERRTGDSLSRSAPPLDLDGNTAEKSKGVGAHERHLSSKGHAPVDCEQCHVVPETVFSPGHVDSEAPAEVTFGTLASLSQRRPEYDRKTGNCTDSYCHRDATVKWTDARTEKDACGTCHGLPPALPHPQKEDCSACHGDVIDKNDKWVSAKLHVNGKVEVKIQAECAGCHGTNPETGAPPPDLSGNLEPSARGVGAHAIHLNDAPTHRAVACNECHQVPESIESDGHLDDDGRAEITFGALAQTKDHLPSYDAEAGSCSNSYCHGPVSGTWQAPRDSEKACGSCHGLPPPAPHPQLTQCSRCHSQVVDANQQIKDPSLHLDGKIEVELTCASCHGTTTDGGPPIDLQGNTEPAFRGVGAHAQHLQASTTHLAVACNECHRVPATIEEPQHLDGDGVPEITFGALASANNSQPRYDGTNVACAGTYCHKDAQPNWRAPRNSADACGSCHALPPPAPHPVSDKCSNCHGRVVNANREIKDPSLHVNGTVEVNYGGCNSCHGQDETGAPPPDLQGNLNPSARGVGAHALHLSSGPTHAAVVCGECHRIPATVEDPGHIDGDGAPEITFGALASAQDFKPSYDPVSVTCGNNYCHRNAQPEWQAPRSSTEACGSCHGLPPSAPHPQNADCSKCHGAVINAERVIVQPALHVNGKIELGAMQCNSCHGTTTDGAPPPDLAGNTASSAQGVGAHAWHVQATSTHGAVACNECHIVPTSFDSPGHMDSDLPAEVRFGALAKLNGSSPEYSIASTTCTGSYCHGQATPNWTAPRASAQACGSCHRLPPPAPHPQSDQCARCHGAVIRADGTFLRPELHVDGQVQLIQDCSGCHGSAQNPAPPVDTSGSSDPRRIGVGAHQLHLRGGDFSRPLNCSDCHRVPTTTQALGHLDSGAATPADVDFGGAAVANGRNPRWDRSNLTCNGSWCHGPADPQNLSPNWLATPGQLGCTSCHGFPPAAPHTQSTQCSQCHGTVDAQNRIIDRDAHVNGEIDL